MSLRLLVLGLGVAAAIGLGLTLGGRMQPILALRSDAPIETAVINDGPDGPVDLTPPYVYPASLEAARLQDQPAVVAPDPLDLQVRRELAGVEADLRASEASLAEYQRAAALVARGAAAVQSMAQALDADHTPAVAGPPDRGAPLMLADAPTPSRAAPGWSQQP